MYISMLDAINHDLPALTLKYFSILF